jgi:predicted phosphohydrolase
MGYRISINRHNHIIDVFEVTVLALYAISDLHLSFSFEKTMDRFGANWYNHPKKIEENWHSTVTDSDTVIIGGDVSWAKRLEQAKYDLDFIYRVPGRKILHQGNHDYWWVSVDILNGLYDNMTFIKNNFTMYENTAICGSRGWLCPNDKYFTPHDVKIYRREQERLRLSLNSAVRAGYSNILLTLHFPPTNDKKEPSAFTEIISEYNIKSVIYGHLHGADSFYTSLCNETEGGVNYNLVSADFLDFKPKKIFD